VRALYRGFGIILMTGFAVGCGFRAGSEPAGVAPAGVYAFSGWVDGETVTGTIAFTDPVLVEGSHGRCIRELDRLQRWTGPFRVGCPGFSLIVRIDETGDLQERGTARIRRPAYRQERTTCRTRSVDGKTCVVWNTATVEYDRWVEGRVEVERHERADGFQGRRQPRAESGREPSLHRQGSRPRKHP
jgi:hypothetical protein